MNSATFLRIACVGVLTSVAHPSPAITQDPALVDRPAGWAVSAPPADPTLAKLSEEQLIDRLRDAAPATGPGLGSIESFWPMGSGVLLTGGAVSMRVDSPAMVELARRGQRALAPLLVHLTDARPTQLVYAVPKAMAGRTTSLAFSDEYDPRVTGSTPVGVNTGERTPLGDSGIYTFRVGDLCYVILGQIVNRELRAVRASGEKAAVFSGHFSPNPGDSFQTINSPIERPALAAAARADWSGVTAQAHAESLRDDFHRPVIRPAENVVARAPAWHTGTITRLLYYYPTLGTELAEVQLRKTLSRREDGYPPPPERNLVSTWDQSRFVTALAPFKSDPLQAALLDLFRQAAAQAEADLRALPPGTWEPAVPSLGGDLALLCARRLARQGHDDELKTFFAARVAAIEMAIQASDSGKIPSVKFVNSVQAGECRKFLAELESGVAPPSHIQPTPTKAPAVAADARVRLASVTLGGNRGSIKVKVRFAEPAPDRIFGGRVIINQARDDMGVTLWPGSAGNLAPIAVGRTSEAEMQGLPKATLEASLTRAAPQAKVLALLEGRVELVVPDFDPDAVVLVEDIAGKMGSPIDSPALRAAKVSITIGDRTMAAESDRSLKAQVAAMHGSDAQKTRPMFQATRHEAGDVALAITDPENRFLNVEFRDADGHSLHYNHNGWSHQNPTPRTRVSVYRLGDRIPPGTQMVVWLRTEKSFVVVPLRATNLPLPEEAIAGR